MQAFGQGSLAHQSAEGGTGLGLPIVKNLVELHGGTFELTSEVRKGTVVTAYFPRQRVLEPAQPLPQPATRERPRQAAPQPQPQNHTQATGAAPAPVRAPRPARLKQAAGARTAPRAAAH
jgi:two-component system cell cycle sensor histidine kinase PleC